MTPIGPASTPEATEIRPVARLTRKDGRGSLDDVAHQALKHANISQQPWEGRMVTHSISRRQVLSGAAVAVPVAAVSFVPTAAYAGEGQRGAQRVVNKYFGILNAGMASTDGDFSALATVYAHNAVLTQSNPAGVTKVFEGLDALTGFYVALWHSFQGIQWSQDHIRNLAEDVVLSYEHAGKPTWTAQGRCAHLFKVRDRRIRTLDWVTYYAGIPA